MYVTPNFKHKKHLKEAVDAGAPVRLLSNSPFDDANVTGEVSVEGPHYPKPHTWYARVRAEEGAVVEVIS